MGRGVYSVSNKIMRSVLDGYASVTTASNTGLVDHDYVPVPIEQVFTQQSLHDSMSPHGVLVRESRDSEEHPESIAILIGLDVTGSMGQVPYALIQDGLPTIMQTILDEGVKDPQVLFVAIGDHECDQAPLQVGQFESSDELMDRWLQNVFLEGNGGGNNGESYHLAWYFADKHTSIDCFEKRNQKGFLFTIGDEPVLKSIRAFDLKRLMGPGQYVDMSASELLARVREKYHVFHVHIQETPAGSRRATVDGWRYLLGDDVLVAQRHQDVAATIAKAIVASYRRAQVTEELPVVDSVIQKDLDESTSGELVTKKGETKVML